MIKQPPKDYDVVVIPSRLNDDYRWLYCLNCGHRIAGARIDKIVAADTGVYYNVDTAYTVYEVCEGCQSHIRIVLATEVD